MTCNSDGLQGEARGMNAVFEALLSDGASVPSAISVRATALCFSVRPRFSPRWTFVESPSSTRPTMMSAPPRRDTSGGAST